ncbi:MAG: pyridoxine 5'-phosphate synthase PdxJ [Paracoccaceae bacterium]|jgi:pyridoxine 5'-phosphate synthase PdxJ
MNVPLLLIGVFLGAVVFASTLYSAWQAFQAQGALRITQALAAVLVICAMASLSLDLGIDRHAGHGLTLISMANVLMEKGWGRVFPMAQFALGMSLAAGLPFMG